MKRLIALAAVVGALAGCSASAKHLATVAPSATFPASSPVTSAPAAVTPPSTSTPKPKPSPTRHGIGTSFVLHGADPKDVITVTLLAVKPTVAPDQYDKPDAGKRYYGAQFRLANAATSNQPMTDIAINDFAVVDSSGQQYDSETFIDLQSVTGFADDAVIAPGHFAKGWVVFQVPKAARITEVQFGLYALNDTAVWELS